MKISNYMTTHASRKSSPAVSSIKINHQGSKCFPKAYKPPLNLDAIRVTDSSSTLKTHKTGVTYEPATGYSLLWIWNDENFCMWEKKNAIIRLTVLSNTVRNMVTWDLCTPKINEMQQPPVTCDAAPDYSNMDIYAGLRRCPYAHHEHWMGSGGNAPLILNLGTRWKWIISFTDFLLLG